MRNRAGIETAERIIDATRALLSQRGLEGATVKAICETAGVMPGSFYNLFDSKEQVVLAVLGEAVRAVDPDPDGTGQEKVVDLIDAFVRFVLSDQTMARVYLVMAITGSLTDRRIAERIARHHQARVARFESALARERPELSVGEVSERAEALVAALNGYAIQAVLTPEFDFESHARRLMAFEPSQ